MDAVERARRYLAKRPPAMSGSGGHDATFSAACVLVEFGLSWDEAWPVLGEWNLTHCLPTWTDIELHHKLADAFRKAKPSKSFVQRHAVTSRPSSVPAASRETHQAESKDTASRNAPCAAVSDQHLPKLGEGTDLQKSLLAGIRGVSVPAVELACSRGLIRFGNYSRRPAWFLLDRTRRMIQARRLDGELWSGHKVLNLPQSQPGWPVGLEEARTFQTVVVVEGAGDLLAAFHLMAVVDRCDVAAVAIVTANARINSAALSLVTGKRVRILAQNDDSGRAAADRWFEQLRGSNADVDVLNVATVLATAAKAKRCRSKVKDWNDLVRLMASRPIEPSLDSIFPG